MLGHPPRTHGPPKTEVAGTPVNAPRRAPLRVAASRTIHEIGLDRGGPIVRLVGRAVSAARLRRGQLRRRRATGCAGANPFVAVAAGSGICGDHQVRVHVGPPSALLNVRPAGRPRGQAYTRNAQLCTRPTLSQLMTATVGGEVSLALGPWSRRRCEPRHPTKRGPARCWFCSGSSTLDRAVPRGPPATAATWCHTPMGYGDARSPD